MKPALITAVGRERMRKMIAYLRELPRERFDFGNISKDECGTVGCVIGHAPHVFPQLCSYKADRIRGQGAYVVMDETPMVSWHAMVGARLFQLSSHRWGSILFTPLEQSDAETESDGRIKLPLCGGLATPTEVADMLESFLEQVDDVEDEKVRAAQ